MKNFEESEAWKEARKLTRQIYAFTQETSFAKDYGLKDQIQRAAVSCMSNISEGFDCDSDPQFILFLTYAKRSASEVQSLLYVAMDNSYIEEKEFQLCYELAKSVRKLCAGFIKYLKNCGEDKLYVKKDLNIFTGDWRPETGD